MTLISTDFKQGDWIIKTDNQLILEFYGHRKAKDRLCYYVKADGTASIVSARHESLMRYDTSWDWLIPVCKKWDEICILYDVDGKYYQRLGELAYKVTLYDIKDAYNQLVDNIKWHNENIKP